MKKIIYTKIPESYFDVSTRTQSDAMKEWMCAELSQTVIIMLMKL